MCPSRFVTYLDNVEKRLDVHLEELNVPLAHVGYVERLSRVVVFVVIAPMDDSQEGGNVETGVQAEGWVCLLRIRA
jgi:hypothetical protein